MKKQRDEPTQQIYVLQWYTLLGFLSVTVFGTLHILVENNPALGCLEISGGLALALNLLLLRSSRNIPIVRSIFLLSLAALLFVMLASGGTAGTGVFWFFLFPVAVFFLTGRERGVYWISGLLLTVILLDVLSELDIIQLWYSIIELRQLVASMVVISVALYVFGVAKERAEKAVHSSQRDLRVYLDNMSTFSAKVDVDGKPLFANSAFVEASGLGNDLLGMNIVDWPIWSYDKVAQERVQGAFSDALSGKTVNYEERMQVVGAHGHHKVIDVSLSMLPIADDGVTDFILVEARDITEIKNLEKAKHEFIILASHQLRTPLTAVRWLSEVLVNGDSSKLDNEQKEQLIQIYNSSLRMASVVDDMLIISSIETDSLLIRPQPIDINQATRRVVQEQMAGHNDKGLVLREAYNYRGAAVPLDSKIFQIIIQNLVSNAMKYTPKGGFVSVEVLAINDKLNPDSKGSVAIILSDNGYGIPDENKGQVFDKFYRGENAKVKDSEGTGLGLYIVKALLGYVGGTISFDSNVGKGTTFVIRIPVEGMSKAVVV